MRLSERELIDLYNRTTSPKIKKQLENEISQPEKETEPAYSWDGIPDTQSPSCFNTILFFFWFFYFVYKFIYWLVN